MPEDEEKKKTGNDEPPLAEPLPPKSAPPPPPGAPPQYYQQPPFEPARFASNKLLFLLIILGAIFMLIGSITINFTPTIGDLNDPSEDDPENQQNAKAAGESLFNVGAFFLVLFLLLAGTFREDINQYARLGMFIAAGIVIAKFLTFQSLTTVGAGF